MPENRILKAMFSISLFQLKEKYELRSKLYHLQVNITQNDAAILHIEDKVSGLKSTIDANCAYKRKDTLIISGYISVVREHESCNNIVFKS